MCSGEVFAAAHHEAAHAVVGVALGLPLQDRGIHIDTIGGGICFNFHRKPGDLGNSSVDTIERERSIVAIKAGYIANCKLFPGTPPALAADDREEETALLSEVYPTETESWVEADKRLAEQSEQLVSQHWMSIETVARALLAKPISQRDVGLDHWCSRDKKQQWLSGDEIASLLTIFHLTAKVLNDTDGTYHSPDLRPAETL